MTLTIVDDGREISLPAKTAEIVRGVIEVSAEIERIINGRLTFHFKGRSVIPELTKQYRALREATDEMGTLTAYSLIKP
jgi:hypothetical protein